MKRIGRIKYVTMGQYDPTTTYTEMQNVLYEGSRWEAKKETTGNAPPDNPKNDDGTFAENEFWRLFLPGALGDDYVKKTDLATAPTETDPGKPGIVMPDGKTIQIDENGLLTGTPLDFMGTWKELQEGLASGEVADGMIGYIEGSPDDTEDPDHPNNMLIKIDDYLSLVSSNAVQNRIITAALNQVKELAEQNAQIIEETRALRASLETFGLAKECPVDLTDATEAISMFLGAREKNPAVVGSLAHSLSILTNIKILANGEMSTEKGTRLQFLDTGFRAVYVFFSNREAISGALFLKNAPGGIGNVRICANSGYRIEVYFFLKNKEIEINEVVSAGWTKPENLNVLVVGMF